MYARRIILLALVELALFTSTGRAQEVSVEAFPAAWDTIFVADTAQGGRYLAMRGKVVDINRRHIVFQVGEVQYLFMRRHVKRVIVTEMPFQERKAPVTPRAEFTNIANTYWNNEESQVVAVVKSLPLVGPPVAALLDDLPRATSTLFAILIFGAVLLGLSYRLYEAVVLTRNMHALNRYKIKLELNKMRYDIVELQHKLGVVEEVSWNRDAELALMPSTSSIYQLEQPLSPRQILLYKILRLPTRETRDKMSAQWEGECDKYLKNRDRHAKWRLFIAFSGQGLMAIVLWLYAITFPILAVRMRSNRGIYGLGFRMEDFGYALIFLLIEILFLAGALRFTTRVKIIVDAYWLVSKRRNPDLHAAPKP